MQQDWCPSEARHQAKPWGTWLVPGLPEEALGQSWSQVCLEACTWVCVIAVATSSWGRGARSPWVGLVG